MINPKLRLPLTETKELPITGYLDRFSGRAGETLKAYVSTAAAPFDAKLVRVISGDPNPAGPGMMFEDLGQIFSQGFLGRRQAVEVGSFVEILEGPALASDASHTWSALCWFTCPPEREATIVSHFGERSSVSLSIVPGGVRGEIRGGDIVIPVDAEHQWRLGEWSRVWLSYDPGSLRIGVGVDQPSPGRSFFAVSTPAGLPCPSGGRVTIAAQAEKPRRCFTGKIEAPAIFSGYVEGPSWANGPAGPRMVAGWDFSQKINSQTIVGLGPDGSEGRTINDPTRAVIGSTWSGTETCWRHAPDQYAAIHFHDDDVGDLGWEETFGFELPAGLKSGAYAFHLTCDQGEDWLPFYVLPPKTGPREKIVFLAPTYTYLAYANCFFANRSREAQVRAAGWGASPYNGRHYGSYGRSTYNWHSDGSGVAFSSRLRPILTMRPGFVFEHDTKGSGVRHYPADTHLLAWLEAKGIGFDVVTDEDLDDEGVDLIRGYSAVLTGSHPEYHTAGTLDALETYLKGGGYLAYLGANGFYWRIARQKMRPDLIEIRRAEGGIRLWAAESGEYFHALDGQLGGLWRRNGRFPQSLTGVGFSAQGPFEASYFRRTQASKHEPYAWIFEGIDEDTIGDYGLSGGGAAGFELDRMDVSLGSAETTVVLATSEGLPGAFSVAPEEMLTEVLTAVGEPPSNLVRGDMTYMPTTSGGGVFSAGSVTFCGSLWRNGRAEGPISSILANVLNRFLASR